MHLKLARRNGLSLRGASWPRRLRVCQAPALGFWLALWLSFGLFARGVRAGETNAGSFRIAFTSAMFTEINENDARAAVKVWAQALFREHGIPTDPDARILKDVPAVLQALQDEAVDAVGMTVPEYAQVYTKVHLGPLFTTSNAGHYQEQYLLLVHQGSPVSRLADLQGRSLNRQYSARLCLAQPRLDLSLLQAGLKPAPEFFGKVSQETKVSKVLLPVFFRQVDACVVSRSGFETMQELNPQLGKRLRVLLSSPELVTTVLAFRANYHPPFKPELVATLNALHQTPAGEQVLNIFQSDRLGEQPEAFFATSLELLAVHARKVASPAAAAPDTNGLARAQVRLEAR